MKHDQCWWCRRTILSGTEDYRWIVDPDGHRMIMCQRCWERVEPDVTLDNTEGDDDGQV